MLNKKQKLDFLEHNDYFLPINPAKNVTIREMEYILEHPTSALKRHELKICPYKVKCNKRVIGNAICCAQMEKNNTEFWVSCFAKKPKLFFLNYLYSLNPSHTIFLTLRPRKKTRRLKKQRKHPIQLERPLPLLIPRDFTKDAESLFGRSGSLFNVGVLDADSWMRFQLGDVGVRHRIIKKICKLITISQKIF